MPPPTHTHRYTHKTYIRKYVSFISEHGYHPIKDNRRILHFLTDISVFWNYFNPEDETDFEPKRLYPTNNLRRVTS